MASLALCLGSGLPICWGSVFFCCCSMIYLFWLSALTWLTTALRLDYHMASCGPVRLYLHHLIDDLMYFINFIGLKITSMAPASAADLRRSSKPRELDNTTLMLLSENTMSLVASMSFLWGSITYNLYPEKAYACFASQHLNLLDIRTFPREVICEATFLNLQDTKKAHHRNSRLSSLATSTAPLSPMWMVALCHLVTQVLPFR